MGLRSESGLQADGLTPTAKWVLAHNSTPQRGVPLKSNVGTSTSKRYRLIVSGSCPERGSTCLAPAVTSLSPVPFRYTTRTPEGTFKTSPEKFNIRLRVKDPAGGTPRGDRPKGGAAFALLIGKKTKANSNAVGVRCAHSMLISTLNTAGQMLFPAY